MPFAAGTWWRAEDRTLDAANRAMEAELGRPQTLGRIERARRPVRQADSKAYVRGLISAFKTSPEWAKLGKTSQAEYTRYLNAFSEEFGDWKVSQFEQPKAKVELLDWRDEWADRPRAADYALQTVGRLFKWARGRGLTEACPTEDVERLRSVDRSDLIWTEGDLSAVLAKAGVEVGLAIRLAAETGLRLGDLLNLPWGAIGEHGIVWRTSKRDRQMVVPLTDEAKRILESAPRKHLVILTNSLGKPWTTDGFKTMFRRAKTDAEITGLRFYDLRGTAASRRYLAGSPKRDIATIMAGRKRRLTPC